MKRVKKQKKMTIAVYVPIPLGIEIIRRSNAMGISMTRFCIVAISEFIASGAKVTISEQEGGEE